MRPHTAAEYAIQHCSSLERFTAFSPRGRVRLYASLPHLGSEALSPTAQILFADIDSLAVLVPGAQNQVNVWMLRRVVGRVSVVSVHRHYILMALETLTCESLDGIQHLGRISLGRHRADDVEGRMQGLVLPAA